MSAERRISHRFFMTWEYDKEEAFLNEMSQKGWQLVKGGCFHTEFERKEGKRYRYRLDYNPAAMKRAVDRERYVETFAADGWEFINATYNGWIYLSKEVREGMTEEDFEIYSDRESLMELFERFTGLFRCACFIVTLGLCLEIYLFISSGMYIILVFMAIVLALFLWLLYGIGRMRKIREKAGR